jgi:hypothetical protein
MENLVKEILVLLLFMINPYLYKLYSFKSLLIYLKIYSLIKFNKLVLIKRLDNTLELLHI